MPATKLANTSQLIDPQLAEQLRDLSRRLKPKLPALQRHLLRRLQAAGYNRVRRDALAGALFPAAMESLLANNGLPAFFAAAAKVGSDLARMNVPPEDVRRAVEIANEVLDAAGGAESFTLARQQLNFSTILVLNQAYHDVRESEARAIHELFHIEVESSNIDVLLRRFLDCMTTMCGATAAHAYVLAGDEKFWELRASTAQAPSPKTLAVLDAKPSDRRALLKPARLRQPSLILDAGWHERYRYVWSVPLGGVGVTQFAFANERTLLPREVEMLAAAADRCAAALHKTRLLEDIALREEQLGDLAIRMLMVEENERRRISRELHDDPGQSLVVIRLQMELIEQSLPPESEARERLAEARDLTEKTILDIRRLIADLSPAVLEQLGLGAALRQLANRFRSRYPCKIRLNVGDLAQLHTNFQLVIYRLAQECFNNILEHSGASAVNISVSTVDGVLRLHVEDNGSGFDVENTLDSRDSFGLIGIRERVAVLGGSVSIFSTHKQGHSRERRKKGGTVIQIELPIP